MSHGAVARDDSEDDEEEPVPVAVRLFFLSVASKRGAV
jgi:hypothetical protein